MAAESAASMRQVCLLLGVATTKKNYDSIAAFAAERSIDLPPVDRRLGHRSTPEESYGSRERFLAAVEGSKSRTEAARRMGWSASDVRRVARAGEFHQVDVPLSQRGGGDCLFRLDRVLIEDSTYRPSALRRRVLKDELLDYECKLCGLGPSWQGSELTLQLDHINGVANDHRLENLRWLCPNCHSQTDTFSGRNRRAYLPGTR